MTDTEIPNVMAYADRLSVRAGETIVFHVSVIGDPGYRAQLVRLLCGDTGPGGRGLIEEPVTSAIDGVHVGREQVTDAGSWLVMAGVAGLDIVGGLETELLVQATLPGRGRQCLMSQMETATGDGWSVALDETGAVQADVTIDGITYRVATDRPLVARRWYRVRLVVAAEVRTLALDVTVMPGQGAFIDAPRAGRAPGPARLRPLAAPLAIAARITATRDRGWLTTAHFDGRLEAPRVVAHATGGQAITIDWDFAADIASSRIRSSAGPAFDGRAVNGPKRAVKGTAWDGTIQDWRMRPDHYAAIHFHRDDLTDAGWEPSLRLPLPPDLRSGIYALKLTGRGPAHHVAFFVTPPPGRATAPVAFLASTVTYQVYATYRRRMEPGPFELAMGTLPMVDLQDLRLIAHPELGSSTYDLHPDGTGVHFVSQRRPQFNLRPTGRYWNFCIDVGLVDWFERNGVAYDVITDHDLHDHGPALLAPYRCVVTGCHPEYHSERMLAALEGFTLGGGRLMYLGGNGFYWRVSFDTEQPWVIEVRRAEDGTRAWVEEPGEYYHQTTGEYGGLWRRLGRPPNRLVGVGFIAQGFDRSSHYRLTAAAADPRVAFAMDGVAGPIIGDHGAWGDGAAGLELDCADLGLGTPPHALVLAGSEAHTASFLTVNEEIGSNRRGIDGALSARVRADILFFETPGGGAVFSTGSIAYIGALWHPTLGYDNPVSRLTLNVVRRFADATPFDCPAA